MALPDPWLLEVEEKIREFAQRNSFVYSQRQREISASFEIGCFHGLVDYYSALAMPQPCNLVAGEYRYLTSPNGNPANYSFVRFRSSAGDFDLRQQIRITCHLDRDITCTPDLVVLPSAQDFDGRYDPDYATGKRRFFSVDSLNVIAAHECKSLNPFPELLASFLGMVRVTHQWIDESSKVQVEKGKGLHLAPSLFVGGSPRGLHARMANAYEQHFPINIILGLHTLLSVSLEERNRLTYVNASS